MRRKTPAIGSGSYIAIAHSWAATFFGMAFLAKTCSSPWIAPACAAYGLALFEIGRFFRQGFLRWQGYSLTAAAFAICWVNDLASLAFHPGSVLLEVFALAIAGYWLLERTMSHDRCTRVEHVIGTLADAAGTLSIALWFAFRFQEYRVGSTGGDVWVTSIWAAMATMLLGLAWLMRRRAFVVQAFALALAAVLRGVSFDLFSDSPPGFWRSPLFHLGLAALILFGGVAFAFRLRGPAFWEGASISLPDPLAVLFRHPEQWFFFNPFALLLIALAVKLGSGHITVAWSLLGVGVFLFALAVGERSFRLTGLTLLMMCVAKILLMDFWSFSLTDRYTTLIVLGLALFAVSFLYTRFGSSMRKLL
jgi:predicted membrane protein DUF2339